VKVADLDYELPPDRIAQQPAAQRDAARLMVLDRANGSIRDCVIRDLASLLRARDCLIFNQSRVLPARFAARRTTGGRVPGLFLREPSLGVWEVLLESGGRLRPGDLLSFDTPSESEHHPDSTIIEPLPRLRLDARLDRGAWSATLDRPFPAVELLTRIGVMPLPPYIRRSPAQTASTRAQDVVDRERYQTVYALDPGSVAAPTAGLHFTPELLDHLRAARVSSAFLTLHVGAGTFLPVTTEDLSDHRMHAEWFSFPAAAAETIERTRRNEGRVVAIGTTTARVLETCYASGAPPGPREGWTDILIQPPHSFRGVDALLTNFHLPRSTLLALVAAFAGLDRIRAAYQTAIERGYRFYSYGDAMLIL